MKAMREKLSFTDMGGEAIAALEALAEGEGSLKERLIEAWTSHLSKLHGAKLRPEFQKRFDHMIAALPKDELIVDAIERLSPDQARILAHRMVHFALDVEMTTGAETR